jgi:hypothetical protein
LRGERVNQACGYAEFGESSFGSHVFGASQASGVPRRRDDSVSCGAQHKVARLPVGKIDRREKILCWMHESSRSGEFRWMTERSTTLSASVLTPTLVISLADEPLSALTR